MATGATITTGICKAMWTASLELELVGAMVKDGGRLVSMRRFDGSVVGMLTVVVKIEAFLPMAFATVCDGRLDHQVVSDCRLPAKKNSQ